MKTGVYPCYENQFQVNTAAAEAEENLASIADLESFSVAFDNGVEEWTPMDAEGWRRALMTGKGITISVTGKRNVGDAGNDAIAGVAFKNGHDVEKTFQWTFPDGTVVKFVNAVINLKNVGGGDATNVAPLEFDVMSNGKPEVVSPA